MGQQFLAGITRTDPFPLTSIDVDVTVTPKQPLSFYELDLYTGGTQVPMVTRSAGRCTEDVHHIDGRINNAGGYPITVGEPVFVGVHGRFELGDDCRDYDSFDLSGYVGLVEVLSGPVEIRFEDEYVDVVVTISAIGRLDLLTG